MVKLLSWSMLVLLAAVSSSSRGMVTPSATAPATQTWPAARNAQNDFDFEMGTWTTSVRLLRNPLSGEAPDWAEYRGTSIVRPLQGGRANLVELSVSGPRGQIEGIAFRLYNPLAQQWSLNYAKLRSRVLTAPVYGGVAREGRGALYRPRCANRRAAFARFISPPASPPERA